jgi:hypothetical protein
MPTYRCYSCGFETTDRGLFLGSQGNGDTYWTEFICPQCSHGPPPVAEVDSDPHCRARYKYPKWVVMETNDGLYVKAYTPKGGSSASAMVSDHPLYNAPASLLRDGLTGSMADHHRWLCGRGKARSEAFKADADRIHAEYDDKLPKSFAARRDHPLTKEKTAEINEARERHLVGPHDDRVEHDGPTLMRKANPRWRV